MADRTSKRRIAVVTGGSSGIGQSIVTKLLSDGMSVAAICRDTSKLKLESEHLAKIKADVTDPTQIRQALDKIRKVFDSPSIDVLVNNAGIAGPIKPTTEVSLKEWNETIEVNLTGAFLCTKFVVPRMIASRSWGRIVNISSMVGKTSTSFRAAYSASKMALIGFTRSLSAELGAFGITVNAVCPGPVEGERIREVMANYARLRNLGQDQIRKNMVERSSLKRMTRPEEVAAAVSFLVSREASAITGQDLNVNSGSGA